MIHEFGFIIYMIDSVQLVDNSVNSHAGGYNTFGVCTYQNYLAQDSTAATL